MISSSCKIETINDLDEIEQVLLLFNPSFPRSLSERVGNLRDYALKLVENAVVQIISLEDKIVGFAAYYCNDVLTKQAFLTQIAVVDTCRGLRIGSALMELCIKTSKQKGMEKLITEVDDTNSDALNFYAKYGFTLYKKASDCSHLLIKKL